MKKLDRELGLFSVFTIACGAMLSGLFVLPGHAAQIGGPTVHLAFLLAGLLFVPAALSKAEMATALPEAGGDYIFIDRAFGPSVSTVTGMGTWLALMLKSAFALVGMSAYLFLIVDLPVSYLKYFACGVGLFLILMNCVGVKKTGQLQSFLVLATFVVLAAFIERGSVNIQPGNFNNMFSSGLMGFLGATAFVFVSYAGVTKVASAAEEIKNPSRNIPWGMLLSLTVMILFYVAVVYVVVGVVPVDDLGGKSGIYKNAPIAQAAAIFLGDMGEIAISVISVLALTAMANAGLLASSRYPLALSRYDQLPEMFSSVHSTFKTPVLSVVVTGAAIILSIIFLPVIQLAKLASAFMLLVFALVHLSLIVFRESEIEWYQPEFHSPLYPYTQFFGVLSSVVLISFMGWLTILGSLGLIGVGILWYFLYVRNRADRLGALFQDRVGDDEERRLYRRARQPGTDRKESVIVPFFDLEDVDPLHVERRLRLAAALCDEGERLDVVDFFEVPEQSLLSEYDLDEEELEMLEERTRLLEGEIENEIHVDQVVTHNSRGALLNYAREQNPHWVVFDWMEPSPWQHLIGIDKWWLEDFPCDSLFVQDNDVAQFEELAVVTEPGPYDGEVLYAAKHIAEFFEGSITFLNPVDADDEEDVKLIDKYQRELMTMVDGDATTRKIPEDEWDETLTEISLECDLMIMGGKSDQTFLGNESLVSRNLSKQLECSYARVRSSLKSPESILSLEDDEDSVDLVETVRELGDVVGFESDDKEDLFASIAEEFDHVFDTPAELEDVLWDRENVQNTYIDHGVAFPHGIVAGVEDTQVRIISLENPVEYTSDGEEVNLCVATIGPPEDRDVHLKLIRKIVGLMEEKSVRTELMEAEDLEGAIDVLNRHLEGSTGFTAGG